MFGFLVATRIVRDLYFQQQGRRQQWKTVIGIALSTTSSGQN